MSFGPQIGRRRQADAGSRIARLTRRALLTGGCAAAGWIGVSLLGGGSAHAATAQPADQSPITAIVSQLPSDNQQSLSGITDLARHTVSTEPVRSVPLSSIRRSIGAVEQRLPKSINKQLDKATSPITDQVVAPVTRVAKQAAEPLASDSPISQTISTVQKPVHQLLHRTSADLHLSGITAPTAKKPATPQLPVVGTPIAQHTRSAHQPTVRHHAKRAHRRATQIRSAPHAAAGPVVTVRHAGPRSTAARSVLPVRATVQHPRHLRIPAPNAPPAPGNVPALNAGAGNGTSGSGSTGGAAVGMLDSAPEAGFRALGTVDPTDAGMARCVAQRPSASPD